MENVLKILENNASVAIFCIALTVFFITNNSYDKLLLESKKTVMNNDVLYEQYGNQETDRVVSYEEIIANLMIGQEHDIRINDLDIVEEQFNYLQFDYNLIPKSNYKQQLLCDNEGNIIKIVYTSEVE